MRESGSDSLNVPHLQLGISDAALMAASDEPNGEVELRPYRKFADSRLGALVAAVHAELVAGFPGETPHQFVLRQRLERAKALTCETSA